MSSLTIRFAHPRLPLLFCVGLMLLGCDAIIDDPGSEPEPTEPICEGTECLTTPEQPTPSSRIPRLTHAQWENTVRDLFRLETSPGLAIDFDPDAASSSEEFSTLEARLFVSEGLWGDYQRAAETTAERVTAEGLREAWLPALPTDTASRDTFLREFGGRAYRRPLTDAEMARFGALYDEGASLFDGVEPAAAGVRIVVQAMLQSPFFVYRVDLSNTPVEGGVEVAPHVLASRLSYLLWASMPDDTLLAAADAGELNEEGLAAQVVRMFDDPRALAMFAGFHDEHFGMASWSDISKEQDVFPDWRPGLGDAMRAESQALLSSVISENGNFRDFLLSRTAFVNEDLARVYGIDGVVGDEPVRVELDERRAGLLTRVGFLTRWSTRRQSDPIHRGLFVNIRLLCRNVPPAPPVDFANLRFEGVTNRERVESVTHVGACAQCHLDMINPPGFALEEFDGIGQFRSTDGGQPVDTASSFTFAGGEQVAVMDGADLSEILADSEAAHVCYTQRLLEYGLGRGVQPGDAPLVYRMGQGSTDGSLSIRDLVVALVTSRVFRLRSSTEVEESP